MYTYIYSTQCRTYVYNVWPYTYIQDVDKQGQTGQGDPVCEHTLVVVEDDQVVGPHPVIPVGE